MQPTTTLLLDMDGVLVDFLPHWLNHIEFRGIKVKSEDCTDFNLSKVRDSFKEEGLSMKEINDILYSCFKEPSFWKTIPIMPGAKDFIRELKYLEDTHFFEFYIVTSPSGSVSAAEKIDYIQRIFGDVKTIITKHKHMIRGDFLVDDHPKNCLEWLERNPGSTAFCPDTPYRGKINSPNVILTPKIQDSWDTILKKVKKVSV